MLLSAKVHYQPAKMPSEQSALPMAGGKQNLSPPCFCSKKKVYVLEICIQQSEEGAGATTSAVRQKKA